jgi:hypothetical protein
MTTAVRVHWMSFAAPSESRGLGKLRADDALWFL